MKTALLLGCGSKFGRVFNDQLLSAGYTIFNISSTNSDNSKQLTVDWNTVNVAHVEKFLRNCPELDLIFFNQNASALSEPCFNTNSKSTLELWKLEKSWSQSYFVSCILPFHVIQTLGNKCIPSTKIGWMLSSYIYNHPTDQRLGLADYIGNKYQNYVLMKTFSQQHRSIFFGINPDNLTNQNYHDTAHQLLMFLENTPADKLNGKVFYYNGTEDHKFDSFSNKNI